MKCILHIGTCKTGTTTLQRFLAENREKLLAEQRILLPRSVGRHEHVDLVLYAMDPSKSIGARRRAGVFDVASAADHATRIEAALVSEVEEHRGRADTLLLSSERCQYWLLSDAEISRLKQLLTRVCSEVKIVVYLRAQHELASSLYSTRLRNGSVAEDMLPEATLTDERYNYFASLKRWSSHFGRENIEPQIFSRADLLDGDVVADFCHQIGIDSTGFVSVERKNEGLDASAQDFLRRMNQHVPTTIDGKPNAARKDLVRLVERSSSDVTTNPSVEDAQAFYEVFADSNEDLRKDWFPERPVLFDVKFKSSEDNGDSNGEVDRSFEMFADIWKAKHREIENLKRQLKSQRYKTNRARKAASAAMNHANEPDAT